MKTINLFFDLSDADIISAENIRESGWDRMSGFIDFAKDYWEQVHKEHPELTWDDDDLRLLFNEYIWDAEGNNRQFSPFEIKAKTFNDLDYVLQKLQSHIDANLEEWEVIKKKAAIVREDPDSDSSIELDEEINLAFNIEWSGYELVSILEGLLGINDIWDEFEKGMEFTLDRYWDEGDPEADWNSVIGE